MAPKPTKKRVHLVWLKNPIRNSWESLKGLIRAVIKSPLFARYLSVGVALSIFFTSIVAMALSPAGATIVAMVVAVGEIFVLILYIIWEENHEQFVEEKIMADDGTTQVITRKRKIPVQIANIDNGRYHDVSEEGALDRLIDGTVPPIEKLMLTERGIGR